MLSHAHTQNGMKQPGGTCSRKICLTNKKYYSTTVVLVYSSTVVQYTLQYYSESIDKMQFLSYLCPAFNLPLKSDRCIILNTKYTKSPIITSGLSSCLYMFIPSVNLPWPLLCFFCLAASLRHPSSHIFISLYSTLDQQSLNCYLIWQGFYDKCPSCHISKMSGSCKLCFKKSFFIFTNRCLWTVLCAELYIVILQITGNRWAWSNKCKFSLM